MIGTDVTTVLEIVTAMEGKYGQAERIWVLDRGMVSDGNLAFLRERKASYIVGTPKAHLRQFEAVLLEEKNWPRTNFSRSRSSPMGPARLAGWRSATDISPEN